MKILVMNLQRLGDVIMSLPVVDGLRRKYPEASIDFLMNKENEGLVPLFNGIGRIHYFDRIQIQSSLGERDRHVLEGYDRIERLVAEISQENYDLAVNLTSNKVSAWIFGLLEIPQKRGFCFRADGSPSFGSAWFQWLNDHGSDTDYNGFHFIDVWSNGAGAGGRRRLFALKESERGHSSAATETLPFDSYVVVQALTSDSKKNWGLENYAEALRLYGAGDRALPIVLMGSPFEKGELERLSSLLQQGRVRHKVIACDLETAFSVLKGASGLLTGDTSIKHLAAAAGTRTLELSIGSSSLWKTGIYLDRSLIIQSLESCAPCPHRNPCSQPRHLCAERIPPEAVALALQTLVNWDERNLRVIAEEFEDDISILATEFSTEGEWHAIPLTREREKDVLRRWLKRSSEKIALNEGLQSMAAYGTEGVVINRILAQVFPEKDRWQWMEILKSLEGGQIRIEDQIKGLESQLKLSLKHINEEGTIDELLSRIGRALDLAVSQNEGDGVVRELHRLKTEIEKSESGFTAIRRGREVLGQIQRRVEIESRLIKALKTQLLESV